VAPSTELAEVPPPPAAAAELFGERLGLAERYAQLLASDGVVRGLIGPREAPRIWERHLLNCVVVAELIGSGATVVDVGSGAGLPGVVLAIARPDLSVVLVEPLARRTTFLVEIVEALGLTRTSVVRARADEARISVGPSDVVVARAVAPLDRLAGWCLPLVAPGGHLLALKGDSAADEVAAHAAAIRRLGGTTPAIHQCGVAILDPPTTVVDIERESGGRRNKVSA
jgi:16S rRNA (guanine527-N7)-methyltransferase